jgi:hypothetical protein
MKLAVRCGVVAVFVTAIGLGAPRYAFAQG